MAFSVYPGNRSLKNGDFSRKFFVLRRQLTTSMSDGELNSLYLQHCCLLLGKQTEANNSDQDIFVQFQTGRYRSIIENSISIQSAQNAKEYLAEIETELSGKYLSDIVKYSTKLVQAATLLHVFIQANICGPAVAFDPVFGLVKVEHINTFNVSCIEMLSSSGEPASSLTIYPHLLLGSIAILEKLVTVSSDLMAFAKWWYSRATIIHQSLLSGPSATLHSSFYESLNKQVLDTIMSKINSSFSCDIQKEINLCYYLELARAHSIYSHELKAQEVLDVAKDVSGLSYILTGAKGKRTKFQRDEKSQLIFLAKSRDTSNHMENPQITSIDDRTGLNHATQEVKKIKTENNDPSALNLNSEVLLEKLKFSSLHLNDDDSAIPELLRSLDPNNQPKLNDLDTALILLKLRVIKQVSPHKDILVEEELMAMVNRIINSPQSSVNWSLFSRALWERSLLESDSVKTVERGTLQIQSLVEELGQSTVTIFMPHHLESKNLDEQKSVNSDLVARLRYIHQMIPLPKWELDKTLAEQFMKLGALKSALDVYERLEMWGDVALCYAVVGQKDQGIKVLSDHLMNYPKDYKGWSILGDITLNPDYWLKAWDIGHYAQAKRSLGRFYYNPPKINGSAVVNRDIDLAIKYLNESLQVNPLHHEAWFIYGCAGLETSQWELAAEAFTRCISLDEEDSKSWSNLATALLRLNKKKEAFNALKRAIGVAAVSEWKIWSNYVSVAADLQEWNDVVRGVKSIIAAKSDKEGENSIDLDVVNLLSQVLIKSEYSDKLSFFQKNCIDLFDNIIPSLITSDARLWKLVAKVHIWQKRPWAALEDYEKGFRIYTHSPLVETDANIWNEAVDYCEELVDAYVNLGPMDGKYGEGNIVCKDWKFKAKSSYRLLLGRGKNVWEDSEGWNRLEAIKENLKV